VIPLSSIISRVRTKHEASSTARWSDAAITESINDGLDELSQSTLFYERAVSIPTVERTYYDLRGYLPESAVAVTSVWSTTGERWLIPVSPEHLGFKWEESTGEPQFFWVRGLHWLAVWPKPNSATGYLRVHFAGLAPHYTVGQDVLADLPDDFVPALEDYSLYDMAAQDGETEKALRHFGEYRKREQAFAEFIERRTSTARHGAIGGLR